MSLYRPGPRPDEAPRSGAFDARPASGRCAARRPGAGPARRAAALAALAVAGSVAPPRALAQDKQACAAAHEEAQILRQKGGLKAARERLKACSRDACPALLRSDCVTWLEQVERSMASIVVEAQKGGVDLVEVQVYLDNELVAPRLNGRAIEVEPGEHLLRFEAAGAIPLQRRVVIREGEKSRLVSALLEDRPPPPRSVVLRRPVPAGVYAFGALGLAGIAGFVGFGLAGNSAKGDLEDRCKPRCDPDEVDAARNKFVLANASLSVGGAALAGAVVWYLLRPAEEVTPARSSLRVVPIERGSALLWQGRF